MHHDFDDDHPADAIDMADTPDAILGALVRWGDFLEDREQPTRADYDDALDSIRKALLLSRIVGEIRDRLEVLRDYLMAQRLGLP